MASFKPTQPHGEREQTISTSSEQLLLESMIKTGKEEKQIAEAKNDYQQIVRPITVIVDGGWSKRSHKHSYNANLGVSHFKGYGKLGKSTIIKIAYGARCAIYKRGQDKDAAKLKMELPAGPRHYLGCHQLRMGPILV